ncbi:hypothetical protein NDK47_10755 [Brevibacillus ruminantium]|uniref:Uncharacterized protein n=1 Tax=Brevibacillus ruminantium TaxID=2950604 RepID=A0ABY4WSZ5_9BACL|nr:hypothetical protein [Brevibacillus ruminantium]USG67721.1 hypothetical protein NDK47_10755 [Brevibacillus ruminantium]
MNLVFTGIFLLLFAISFIRDILHRERFSPRMRWTVFCLYVLALIIFVTGYRKVGFQTSFHSIISNIEFHMKSWMYGMYE